ncbi:MAG TPA: SO2930 family diheme c-type cytochrome [Candidatus Limnocylindrales bacterium]|nr:SO2930 family diheme c-type cytochrome [Candidatus Limnocylindrales bacterium]
MTRRGPVSARRRRARLGATAAVCVCGLFAACGLSRPKDVRLHIQEPYPRTLADWHLFTKTSRGLEPNARVIPYDLNTPLFSDYASKYRFVWMPQGAAAEYREDGAFEFPVGAILAKTFAFPVDGHPGEERLIETRLLVHTQTGWTPLPYVWNSAQTEATLKLAPDPVPIRWTDAAGRRHDFTYQIPNTNECHECHDNNKTLLPIGPKARNLNKDYAYSGGTANQIAHWTQIGYLRGAPAPDAIPRAARWEVAADGSLDARARAYLDNNCAHCHQPGGTAGYTGVDFRLGHFDASKFGFCKRPNSAGYMGGRDFDLVPGHPERSILIYRMESTAPKVMMPQIGRAVVHEEGVELLREWISSLPADACRANSD